VDIDRIRLYASLRSTLTALDDSSIRELLRNVPSPGVWGSNGLVRINRRRVFAKRIPLTDREFDERLATKNFGRIPTFYSYGIGSMGTNPWREVVAATKATNWVLAGECESFPLMFHHRVLRQKGRRHPPPKKWLDEYIHYWGESKRIGKRVVDRALGPAELVLFFEYFPSVWADDCRQDLTRVAKGVDEITKIVEFLRVNGITHFDAHPHNVLTDAKGYYLTDFGLAMDRDFDLDDSEKRFLQRHTRYDRANVLARAAGFLTERFRKSSERRRALVLDQLGIKEPESGLVLQKHLVDGLQVIAQPLQIPDSYSRFLNRFRQVINLVSEFDRSMTQSGSKSDKFQNRRVGTLLKQIDR
jgi:hypothetical protein